MINENQLIKLAKAGDLDAFHQLVECYSRKLYATAYRILNNKELAEDCVQEVFIKVYQKLARFNEKSKLSTWLYSVTVNTAIDLQRKFAKQNLHEEYDFEQMSGCEGDVAQKSIWIGNINQMTKSALMQLNQDVRIAFMLRHHEERSIEEISQILQVNPNTVKNRIFRAVARLREILQSKVGDYEKVD